VYVPEIAGIAERIDSIAAVREEIGEMRVLLIGSRWASLGGRCRRGWWL
jgi:hypothetical protein